MRCKLFRFLTTIAVLLLALRTFAQHDPHVGEVAMSPKKTLMQNVTASPIHKSFVQALHATGVDQVLNGSGLYTVFAPTDDAFRKLPAAGSGVSLSDTLAVQMKYHVVPGKLTSRRLGKLLKKGHNTVTLQTLAGQPLTINRYGTILVMTDGQGGTATVVTSDVLSKDGLFDVIDAVLMPR